MRVVMLAYGSWGDVRPYVMLAQALQYEGFEVVVLAAEDFRSWVEAHGVEFVGLRVNVQQVIDSMINASDGEGTGTNFIASVRHFSKIISAAMMQFGEDVADVVRTGDALLYVEVVQGLVHGLVEKYHLHPILVSLFPTIPTAYFPVFNLPDLPTWVPARGWYNRMSGGVLRWATWQIVGRQGNKIRTQQLGLPRQSWRKHRALLHETPQLLLVSRYVLTPPADWSSQIHMTGYIFDDDHTWQPPQNLLDYLADGEKPIYIGFGSMWEKDPKAITHLLLDALQQAGKRAVLLSGWAGIGEVDLPDTIFQLKYAPHSWLFPRMAAVVHHGGAGTIAAGLRAGVPTITVPKLGDQPFWGRRVYELGAGTKPITRGKLTANNLAVAIQKATDDQHICERAQELSQLIQSEDGLGMAVATIKRLLD